MRHVLNALLQEQINARNVQREHISMKANARSTRVILHAVNALDRMPTSALLVPQELN